MPQDNFKLKIVDFYIGHIKPEMTVNNSLPVIWRMRSWHDVVGPVETNT